MDLLERNLAVLEAGRPGLAQALRRAAPPAQAALEPSRQGAPSLRVGELRLTSAVDPAEEGRRQAQAAPPGPLACLGFGLGYHLEPLAGRDLVVWEPDAGLLRLALSARDLTRLLPRLRLAVDPADLPDLSGRQAFVHRPSARLHPWAVEVLERALAGARPRPPRPARPRVLVAPPMYGGSLPVAQCCAQALEDLGCQVRLPSLHEMWPYYRRLQQSRLEPARLEAAWRFLLQFVEELLVVEALEHQADLCLALAQAPLGPAGLRALRREKIATAFWFVEDFRLMPYFRQVAGEYDHFFHIQGPEMEAELARLGARGRFLPMAAHPPLHRPLDLTPEERRRWGAPVGFLGEGGYPNRPRIFGELLAKGARLRLWGTGWPAQGPLAGAVGEGGRRLEPPEVVAVYNACAITINLHSSLDAQAPPGGRDFLNPRTFEVPACGGFQLVDRVQGLERFFAPDEEVACFADEAELADKIAHYLARPEERARLAVAGRQRVLRQHTYYHRLDELLDACLGPAGRENDPALPCPARATDPEAALERLLAGPRAAASPI